ncbi:MAG TPA: AGE family epimerase/isomerase [Verrucomicrobiae bacterium]
MDLKRLEDFAARVRRELFGNILPFWTGPALDHQHGGWLAWLSNDLKPDHSRPKGLILNSRILWAFSAVYRAYPDLLCRQMAERAAEVVMNRFWDSEHGGAYWRLDATGHAVDDSKKIYGQAFYIYALAEYWQAFAGQVSALARTKDLFELLERHARDPIHGGYWEVRRRDWSEAAEMRLSEKDMNEKKSMNNHLHVLEAYTNLYRVWKDPRLEARLRELIRIFHQRILQPGAWHLNHFFDERWQVRSDSCTYGHDIEASWLLCEAAEALGDDALCRHAHELGLQIANAVHEEALEADGGLCYEGRHGQIIDRGKECWPQAEAIIGFINAFQLSGKTGYLEAAMRVWDFIERHLVDREHGEWFWRVNPDGTRDTTLPKLSEWKGPYHGTRACLETLRRLSTISRV